MKLEDTKTPVFRRVAFEVAHGWRRINKSTLLMSR